MVKFQISDGVGAMLAVWRLQPNGFDLDDGGFNDKTIIDAGYWSNVEALINTTNATILGIPMQSTAYYVNDSLVNIGATGHR